MRVCRIAVQGPEALATFDIPVDETFELGAFVASFRSMGYISTKSLYIPTENVVFCHIVDSEAVPSHVGVMAVQGSA